MFVNPMDIDEVSNAIVYAFEHPEDLKTIGKRGKEAIRKKHNWQNTENFIYEGS
jgi:hypothetical protein